MINYITLTLGAMTCIVLISIHSYYSTKYQLGKILHYLEIRKDFAALSKDVNKLDQLHNFPTLQKVLAMPYLLKNQDPRSYKKLMLRKKTYKTNSLNNNESNLSFDSLVYELNTAPEEIQTAVYQLYNIFDHIFAINAPLKHKLHQLQTSHKKNIKKNLNEQDLNHSPKAQRNTTVTDIAYLTNFPPFTQGIPKHS